MKTITSRENAIYKSALKLLRRKYREESGMYLLEGTKPLLDAVETGSAIEKIFFREDSGIGIIAGDESIENIYGQENILCLSGELFDKLSDTEHSQGVIALIKRKKTDAEDLLDSLGKGNGSDPGKSNGSDPGKGNIIVLDRLQDPGNAGTIIRTAEAAGFAGIIALKGTTDIFSPKVVRAAAGSILRMPVATGAEETEAIRTIKDRGFKLITTSVDGGTDCFTAEVEGPSALVIGNEGSGISDRIQESSDMALMIPMRGGIESLNAAVAAGILMYQLRE